ncbi:hypothetical protein PIROE2DRAFT_5763 [Piromyces sp. E2]|nr:hypothetical protein PIROE2DRAFT_5763 [Piromyces sp. E2]|eukprot:OUM66904.1 hypothetical protein PIROE2DRAFT_5763 [Piromyces sp. E2]
MKFQQIGILLTFLSLNLKVLSLPYTDIEGGNGEIDQQNTDIINESIFPGEINLKSENVFSAETLIKMEEKARRQKEKQRQKEERQRQKEERQRQKEERQKQKEERKEEKQRQKEEKQRQKDERKKEKQRQKEEKQRQKEEKQRQKENKMNYMNNEDKETEKLDDDVCMTTECIESSKRILSNMDTTANPCEDFYQYACGGWMEQNELPSNSGGIDTSAIGYQRNMIIIKNILERDYKVNEKLTPEEQELDKNLFNKLKSIFNTCMDVDKINAKGKQPLMDLYDKLQIYENREKYNSTDGLTEEIITLNKYGIFPFFKIGGHTNYEKSNSYLIAILQNGLTLSKDNYSNESHMVEFKKYIKNLSENYPKFNWSLFFKKRLANHNINFEFDNETIFIDMTPDYLAGLNNILEEADVDSIAYYLEWRVISRYYEYLSSDLQKPVKEFSEYMFGVSAETSLYGKCFEMVDDMMDMALGKYYIEETFDYDVKKTVEDVFKNIKQSMIERIPQMEWLDQETSNYAIEKVKMIKENIAYPDYLMDLEKMTKKYELLEIDPDDYFNNIISYINMYQRNDLNRVVEPNTDWRYSPQTFNGFYYPPDNSINILAGILQPPFYDSHEPDYINYDGIGMLVGHELTHAFDGTGRQFDMNGNMNNWWSQSTAVKFNNATQCFIDQYSNYTIVGSDGKSYNVDGEYTFNENISDNGGVDRAYEAWKISMNNNPEKAKENNKKLPDFTEYTKDQLFFISFGQIWCSKMRPEVAIQRLYQDNHAPNEWRVKGVLRNSKHFVEAFNCPTDSPMNPEQKCSIW